MGKSSSTREKVAQDEKTAPSKTSNGSQSQSPRTTKGERGGRATEKSVGKKKDEKKKPQYKRPRKKTHGERGKGKKEPEKALETRE